MSKSSEKQDVEPNNIDINLNEPHKIILYTRDMICPKCIKIK